MSKYIDAEKLIAELRRQKHELKLSIQSQGDYGQSCHIVAYENILSLIDSLQQEQPDENLDEAARDYGVRGNANGVGGEDYAHDLAIAFKVGAEWMANRRRKRNERSMAYER